MDTASPEQVSICARFGSPVVRINADAKMGVALDSLARPPLNALRYPTQNGTSGWYIWGGEFSGDADFFQPLHAAHISNLTPALIPYLALAP